MNFAKFKLEIALTILCVILIIALVTTKTGRQPLPGTDKALYAITNEAAPAAEAPASATP